MASVSAVYEKNQLGLTCMLTPQFDYDDKNEPDKADLEYYLRMINEERERRDFPDTVCQKLR